jgi:hypothetical protein
MSSDYPHKLLMYVTHLGVFLRYLAFISSHEATKERVRCDA